MELDLKAALGEEVRRLDAEETASATRVERAGDAAAALPTPPERPSAMPPSPATPVGEGAGFDQAVSLLSQMGEDQIAALALTLVDVIVTKKFGERYALTSAERERLQTAAVPVVRLYLPNISVHPVTGLLLVAIATYAMKLPEGVLASVLGGAGKGSPSSNTPASTTGAAA